MLSEKQLIKLRSEIILCSLNLSDYENSLGIHPQATCNFFESYAEKLSYLMKEDGHTDRDFFDILNEYDTEENLWKHYCMYEEDPLPIDIVYKWMVENRIPYSQYRIYKRQYDDDPSYFDKE